MRFAVEEFGAKGRHFADHAELIETLKKGGMTVTAISPAETNKMREKLKPIVERYTHEIGADIVEQAQKEIAAARGG